jgi:predicted RNA-binding Zn ribbon-like protein
MSVSRLFGNSSRASGDRTPTQRAFRVAAVIAGSRPPASVGASASCAEPEKIRHDATIGAVTPHRDDKTAAGTLEAVRALRERLYRLLLEPADTSDQELAALQHTFAGALSRGSLEPTLPLQWRPRVDRPNDLPWLIALAAIELLRSPDVLRVRQCAGDGCGWLFLDHSRNQSRRWCSSSDCGNRHRVKNHDARPRRTGSSRS